MRLTLRQLQVFSAVYQQRSYSKAAESMALTQPAVSLQMRQLEEIVGYPLFDYMNKTLYATEAARVLFESSREAFQLLDTLNMRLSDLQGHLKGDLRLAVESSAETLTPWLFAAFQRRHPDIQLNLHVSPRHGLLKRLNQNLDDLLILSGIPREPELTFLPFTDLEIIAVTRACDELPDNTQRLTSLEALPLLSREPGSGTRRACEEFFQERRTRFNPIMSLGSNGALRAAALAGLGVALINRHAVREDLAAGQLCALPLMDLPIRRSWCIAHPRGKRLSPVATAFFAFLREERQEIKHIERILQMPPAAKKQ